MTAEPDDGYIADYISGIPVRATPEEVNATQVFAHRLVEELGYSPAQIRTRPQFRIKDSPSGTERWPVDICVFKDDQHTSYQDAYIIVECKRPSRRDGQRQLMLYLQNSFATIGVWFNGNEHLYLRKRITLAGKVQFVELYTLPKMGQSLADVGRVKLRELKKPSNLKSTFNDLRNHLAGMATGTTQDIDFAKQLINILFCKIWDEQDKALDDLVDFHADLEEQPAEVARRIRRIFETKVKARFSGVFDPDDKLSLDPKSIAYIVGELQTYALTHADRDALGDAFETFIGKTLKGPEGQFFTPRNVIRMMVHILDPEPNHYILDPACGSGGFLIASLDHVWAKLDGEAERKGWTAEQLGQEKAKVAQRYFRGCDKDQFLTKVTRAYMAIVGDGQAGIVCDNSLLPYDDMQPPTRNVLKPGQYDFILTNPPFGSKIKIEGRQILEQFELARAWRLDPHTDTWMPSEGPPMQRPPQILFIERCIDLLRAGGKLAIVLPESTFGNPSHRYVIAFLQSRVRILGLVSMPEDLFQPYTHAKACVLFAEKLDDTTQTAPTAPIFMGVVKWCGHDSRGNPIPYDDVPKVADRFDLLRSDSSVPPERYGFLILPDQIRDTIYIPKYYDPEIEADLARLSDSHDIVSIGELVRREIIAPVTSGHEVGKLAYGTGSIPFIRTSDLSNWELKIDPKQGISRDIAGPLQIRQQTRPCDILLVRDGTYLVGTTAMLTSDDTDIVFQSHLLRIRVQRPEELSPYLLLALLNTALVKRQIRAKQFTQDIIDTLGQRILEVKIPLPRDRALRDRITRQTKEIVESRARLRNAARDVVRAATGAAEVAKDELADVL